MKMLDKVSDCTMIAAIKYLLSKHPNLKKGFNSPVIVSGVYIVGKRRQVEAIQSVFGIRKEGDEQEGEVYYIFPLSFPKYKIPFDNIAEVYPSEDIRESEQMRQLCMTA